MAGADEPHPHLFLQSLQQHVRSPLATADRVLEREHDETTAERDAFAAFTDRLATIDPVAPTTGNVGAIRVMDHEQPSEQTERVRTAYRETVMSVPHYDEVYGESLAENMAAEFGPEVTACVSMTEPQAFTQPYKNALQAAAAKATRERQAFVEALDREAQSIADARTELTELLAALNTTIIPEWQSKAFADRLNHIAQERQEALRTNRSLPRLDGHSFCGYLYQSEPWLYPVLTAVTRLREAVVI